jgi:thiol-disulfide isomerase/thioredoxin
MTSTQIAIIIVLLLIAGYLWFNTEHLTNGDGKPFIVLFSQDWCPACQDFKPTWKKFAQMQVVTDVINPIQLDPLPFNVGSFPTIRFYKRDPTQYPDEFVVFKGQRNLGQLLKFVRENTKTN